MAGITPSSTVGPFFLFGLVPSSIGGTDIITNNLATPEASGERIRIEGAVFDGDGVPVPDAVLEIWQADGAGRYPSMSADPRPNAAFRGFGRAATDADGRFIFETIKPGRTAGHNGALQAPHVLVTFFARGVLKQMVTRIYFSDEASNADDSVLALVPADRRATLIAARNGTGSYPTYRFDIHLQGERETVFFET
jgi:protocatechuate 3,4-dioxygenase alpha subunit